ncbi:PEP-CTERM sorting domain-containing protein [Massilia sp. PAMC28688]|uniref:PEP-CTERM sorting domain-containing protein n=1 Tax=Massilia sp. PAMC28688 TaxID=2861283 RepID=UPI001C63B229|nr:PEP-CTERM sorting domain-containing protein [Massilia sp. PAMC28688]QYF95249.1 PEP-CTERM sorting domain-containing protein [Massilia sp. PAMC28688]
MKKIIALAAFAVFSSNAIAGYTQYGFGGPLSGYFIQRDDDQSISYFYVNLPIEDYPRDTPFTMVLQPIGGEGSTRLTDASTYFRRNGPTNFSIFSDFGGDQFTTFAVSFSRGKQGNFSYTANYHSTIYGCYSECVFSSFAGSHVGTASKGTVNADLAAYLDQSGGYYDGVTRITPSFLPTNNVPEPGSLALLGLSVAALLVMRQKQLPIGKSQRRSKNETPT